MLQQYCTVPQSALFCPLARWLCSILACRVCAWPLTKLLSWLGPLYLHRNLLANPFSCNCHLAWLGEWLRKKRIVTGNPRCQTPYFLKEIPIQDVAVQDFACEDGMCVVLSARTKKNVNIWCAKHIPRAV